MVQLQQKVLVALSLLLAGLIIGLGFIAAWAKFQATAVSTTDLLQVGRSQFGVLHQVERVLIPAVLVIAFLNSRTCKIVASVMASLFLVQEAVILPQLDARMVERIRGAELPASNLHELYVVNSSAIVVALVALAFLAMRGPVESPESNASAASS